MTAFATLDAFVAALKAPRAYGTSAYNPSSNSGSSGYTSHWLGNAGVAPGGNSVPLSTTAGALCNAVETGADLFVGEIDMSATAKSLRWALILADRLVHTDGLSGTAAGAQTTNLPTTALTRATTGADVRAALEIYSAVGSTNGITVTCSYTSSAAASGHTSEITTIGSVSAAFQGAGAFLPLPLASGDSGVKSVESVTLSGSTGAVGNFGVTLYRPLCTVYALGDTNGGRATWCPLLGPSAGSLPKINSNACLFWILAHISNDIGANVILNSALRLVRQ